MSDQAPFEQQCEKLSAYEKVRRRRPLGAHGGACAESVRREISPGKSVSIDGKTIGSKRVDENAEKPGARPGFSLVQWSETADQKV
jgi:hypothetical protein